MDDLGKALNACYQHELTLVVRYLNLAVRVTGLDRLHLADFFKESASESIGHAAKVGGRMMGLGIAPHGKVSEDLGESPETAEKMLERALHDESAAADAYSKAITLAKNDLGLRETLIHILKDERDGLDELKLLLKK
ncbi:MAG TPA: ferritin-like domain-containing protein [Planctomycetota bacterium]|nr:ferritin-like domain-containing protein [Planctomycetota bacterium]